MISHVMICGAGTMGGGIAISCLAAGLTVTVYDTSDLALDRLHARVETYLSRQVEKQRIAVTAAAQQLASLALSRDLAQARQADLVIEAVFEDHSVKCDLFRALAPILSDSALVATNTSALCVGDLAKALPDSSRFVGLHYFSPAEINPVVEVVAGADTASEVVAAAMAFVAMTGKRALRCKDAPGFAVNRFFCPYTNEAVRILEEGIADAASIDAIACAALGLSLGPFAVMNIVKPRINMHAVANLAGLGAFYEPARLLRETGEADASWTIDSVKSILPSTRDMIADRLRAAVFLPVLEAIGEDVASPEAFELGACLALRFQTGPVAQMWALTADRTRALVEGLCAIYRTDFPEAGFARVFAAPKPATQDAIG